MGVRWKSLDQEESALQRQIAEFCDRCLPDDAIWLTIPGGDGKMTLAPGYKSGTPDGVIIHRGKAIFFELKRKRRSRTHANQLALHSHLTLCGAVTCVCRSLEEFEGFISMIIPLKGRVA